VVGLQHPCMAMPFGVSWRGCSRTGLGRVAYALVGVGAPVVGLQHPCMAMPFGVSWRGCSRTGLGRVATAFGMQELAIVSAGAGAPCS